MSTATELANVEAAIVEAELTDEEAALVKKVIAEHGFSPDEAIQAALVNREAAAIEAAAPADAPGDGEPSPKQWQTLDRENQRHERRVHEIMGGAVAGFGVCETCAGVGLVPPGPSPQTHAYFKSCETCLGFGQVLTGSLREGQNVRDCPECRGRGYLEAINEAGAPLAESAVAQSAAPLAPPAAQPAEGPAPVGGNGAGLTFGAPAWMGDPTLGR